MALRTRAIGLLQSADFQRAKLTLEHLHLEPSLLPAPECEGIMEFQWTMFTKQLRKEHGEEVWEFSGDVAVFCEGKLLGGVAELLRWAEEQHGYQDFRPQLFHEALAKEAYNAAILNPERSFVFMDMCVEGDLIGRLVFELYSHLCPRTAANFAALCSGGRGTSESGVRLSYTNSVLHRVVPNGWIQGGDICGGSGAKGESIYGPTFEDECYAVSHDSAGVLGMANCGRHTNSSQFYITLQPALWMDRKYVAFGRVVEGSGVLRRLAGVKTYNERPKELCQVSNCGLLAAIS